MQALGGRWVARGDNTGLLAQKRLEFLDGVARHPELPAQHLAQLCKDGLAEHQLMFRENQLEELTTEAACSDGADHDICVEEGLQETSRKTSSSVRYPRASARGVMRRRQSSNCTT